MPPHRESAVLGPGGQPAEMDCGKPRRSILPASSACGGIGRRARLRALWTDWSVEVRVLSGALGKPRTAGLFCILDGPWRPSGGLGICHVRAGRGRGERPAPPRPLGGPGPLAGRGVIRGRGGCRRRASASPDRRTSRRFERTAPTGRRSRRCSGRGGPVRLFAFPARSARSRPNPGRR